MRIKVVTFFSLFIIALISCSQILTSIQSWEIYVTASERFQIHYIPPGSGFPLYEVTLSQVQNWGMIVDDA
ncbi:MAG: hypothetical protein ACFFAJ_16450, partial [Candidatus Hodarchaeota archaeon]